MKAWSKEKELSGLSDAQLVQCFIDGNNCCFTKIVERHHLHVHNLLHYKLHNPEWEKDAEQETFIVAAMEFRSGHYHDTGHLSQYLNGIAFKQAMLIFRTEHPYVHHSTALSNDEQAEQSTEEIFPEREQNTALFRFAMKKLSPHHRLAIELRDIDELPFCDIGLRMDISEVSARTTYFKAKRHLKQIIERILSQRRATQQSRHSA